MKAVVIAFLFSMGSMAGAQTPPTDAELAEAQAACLAQPRLIYQGQGKSTPAPAWNVEACTKIQVEITNRAVQKRIADGKSDTSIVNSVAGKLP